ncbi:MAG: replication initiation protein RepC [Boseongicola sp.]|nr:replication initiation protein RepC [Boseongicola sp.]
MTEPIPGVANGPATMHAPAGSGAYDHAYQHQVQAFVPKPDQHFRLPDDVTKAQAVATTCRALRLLGASERVIAVWRHVADTTERQAWHAGDRAPVNWRRQCDLAREMEIGERQFRRIEAELARMGVLARMTADNGYRGRRSGQSAREPISCGLSVAPALANYRAFAAIVAEAERAEETRQAAVLNARAARRRVGLLIASLDDVEMRRWAKGRLGALEEAVRPASPRVASSEALSLWHAELLALEDAIREALAPLPAPGAAAASDPQTAPSQAPAGAAPVHTEGSGPVEDAEIRPEMSGAPDIGVRCHIQPATEPKGICRDPAPSDDRASMSAAAPGGPFPIPAQGNGPGPHAPPLSPTLGARLTERDIRGIASDDVALWLDAMDWQDALPHVLRELGVNVSAWHDACNAMGEPVAFLALLVIDRNRFHPDTPVLNPGGALRAFTRRARLGQLDLTRSILGIWERERQERQPKGPQDLRRPS